MSDLKVLLCSSANIFKELELLIPYPFRWQDDLVEVRNLLRQPSNQSGKFILTILDRFNVTIDEILNQFGPMNNVIAILIAFPLPTGHYPSHPKLHYVKPDLWLQKSTCFVKSAYETEARENANGRAAIFEQKALQLKQYLMDVRVIV